MRKYIVVCCLVVALLMLLSACPEKGQQPTVETTPAPAVDFPAGDSGDSTPDLLAPAAPVSLLSEETSK